MTLDQADRDERRPITSGRMARTKAVAVLAIFGIVTPATGTSLEPMTTPALIAACVALLFPAGFFMGWRFRSGRRLEWAARAS